MTPYKLYKEGYISKNKLNRYYREYGQTTPFEYEYNKVCTNEGHGVIHALVRNPYIPYKFLSDKWAEVHKGSWHINVQNVPISQDPKGFSAYIVNQYVADQGTSYQRSSCSKNWIYSGWRKDWLAIMQGCPDPTRQKKDFNGNWYCMTNMQMAVQVWTSYLDNKYLHQPITLDYQPILTWVPEDQFYDPNPPTTIQLTLEVN